MIRAFEDGAGSYDNGAGLIYLEVDGDDAPDGAHHYDVTLNAPGTGGADMMRLRHRDIHRWPFTPILGRVERRPEVKLVAYAFPDTDHWLNIVLLPERMGRECAHYFGCMT